MEFRDWSPPGPAEPQTSSEDCLYLNIWTPIPPASPSSSAPLFPIMFFIVGGDYDFDGAQNGAVDGRGIAATSGAIVVVANSRLGVFGYLGSEQLRAINPHQSTGNYGILDQRLALQWVQMNAQAFHGDKARVLIFGESSVSAEPRAQLLLAEIPYPAAAAPRGGSRSLIRQLRCAVLLPACLPARVRAASRTTWSQRAREGCSRALRCRAGRSWPGNPSP